MYITLSQNEYGSFNLFGNEKSTVCSIRIVNDDGTSVMKELSDGKTVLASVKLLTTESDTTESNEYQWDQLNIQYFIDNVDTTNHLHGFILFKEVFEKNRKEILDKTVQKKKEVIQRKINSLQKEIESIDDIKDVEINFELSEMNKYKKWASEDLSDFVKGSKTWKEQIKTKNLWIRKYNEFAELLGIELLEPIILDDDA